MAFSPDPGPIGKWVTVTLTVTNAGTKDASLATPLGLPQFDVGGALVVFELGPSPSGPLPLPAGAAVTFAWTYSVTAVGTVTLTATVTVADDTSGLTMIVARTGSLATVTEGQVQAVIAVAPAPVTVGDVMTVTLYVTNPGTADTTGITPDLLVTTAAGGTSTPYATLLAGPVPATFALPPGVTKTFAWSFTITQAGTLIVSATATGTDSTGGGSVSAASALTVPLLRPAGLSTSLLYASVALEGATAYTVALTVSNTGDVAINGLTPVLVPSKPALVTLVSGPVPPGPLVLAGLGSAVFVWTYIAEGPGTLTFAGTVSGVAANDGALSLTRTVSTGTVTILGAARLVLRAAAVPASSRIGGRFVIRLTVSNTGSAAANAVMPGLALADAALARVVDGPLPAAPGAIPAKGALTYEWNLTGLRTGVEQMTLSATALDGDLGLPVAAPTAPLAEPLLPQFEEELVAYPNPASLATFKIVPKLDDTAARVVVDAYDAALHRVFTGTYENVAPAGAVVVTNVDRWAPGVYLLRVRADLIDGRTQKFPLYKLMVKRSR